MILAAGLSTRLGTLSTQKPKPLLPMANVPLIRYGLALLRKYGINDVIVNVHHLGASVEAELGSEVSYSRETDTILGTGGGVKAAADFLGNDPFVLINGKVVLELDLGQVIAEHERSGAIATMVVRSDVNAHRWGAVDVDEGTGLIRDLRAPAESGAQYMFTGIHVIGPDLLKQLPSGASDIVADGYLPRIRQGAPVGAFRQSGYFGEHSTPERYWDGNLRLLNGHAFLPYIDWSLEGLSPQADVHCAQCVRPPVLIAPGAIIEEGASVGPNVVIGARSRIRRGVTLKGVVVWPDTDVVASASNAIVTPSGSMVVAPGGSWPPATAT